VSAKHERRKNERAGTFQKQITNVLDVRMLMNRYVNHNTKGLFDELRKDHKLVAGFLRWGGGEDYPWDPHLFASKFCLFSQVVGHSPCLTRQGYCCCQVDLTTDGLESGPVMGSWSGNVGVEFDM